MKRPPICLCACLAALLALLWVAPAAAQQPIVYPAKGQTQEQQNQDMADCNAWAMQNTGINPAAPPPPPSGASSQGSGGHLVRGAARGAAVGAVAGAIGGNAGKGAAAGAAGGALLGGFQRRDERRAAEQQQDAAMQQYQAETAQRQQTFNRAYAACLEAKGYTVK